MKVVITVTAVYDFPEDVEIEDLIEGEGSLGQHIVVEGRKFQPFIDFTEYEGIDGDNRPVTPEDEEELEEIYDAIDDCLESEEYTMIEISESIDGED
jgi:hypothetical protein